MTRKPSIHITEGDLMLVLIQVFKKNNIKYDGILGKLAKDIVAYGKGKSLSHRGIYVSNDKLLKKAEKITASSRSETGLFAQLLVLLRRRRKHRGIRVVKPGESEWLNIKEMAKLASEFCNEFGVPIKEGYKAYIDIGLGKMKNYSLYKFKQLHQTICKTYECREELRSDPTPEDTEEAYEEYMKILLERVGTSFENLNENPEKYIGFMYACRDAETLGLGIRKYIKIQFASMEWRNGIPDPLQLYGDKARNRAVQYCYENQIRLGKKIKVNLKKIRDEKADKNLA